MADIQTIGPEDRRFAERVQYVSSDRDNTISVAWLMITVGALGFWAAVLAFVDAAVV